MSHVFLIGFMGAGKSTVGPLLAEKLGRPFTDVDTEIAARERRSITQIFAEDGEGRFRGLEREALEALSDREPSVVACGGGIVTVPESRELLGRLGTVVYLRTTAAETLRRIPDRSSRPLLAGPDALGSATALLDERAAQYSAVADIEVDTVGQSPSRLADEIARLLQQRGAA